MKLDVKKVIVFNFRYLTLEDAEDGHRSSSQLIIVDKGTHYSKYDITITILNGITNSFWAVLRSIARHRRCVRDIRSR